MIQVIRYEKKLGFKFTQFLRRVYEEHNRLVLIIEDPPDGGTSNRLFGEFRFCQVTTLSLTLTVELKNSSKKLPVVIYVKWSEALANIDSERPSYISESAICLYEGRVKINEATIKNDEASVAYNHRVDTTIKDGCVVENRVAGFSKTEYDQFNAGDEIDADAEIEAFISILTQYYGI